MTDARLHPTFLTNPKIDNLSDAAFRVYVNGVVHAASQETDGHLARRALRLLHPDPIDLLVIADALRSAGLWESADGGWSVHDFREYQTSKAQAEARREMARLRQVKSRAKSQRDKTEGHGVTDGVVTPSDKGQDRTGQAQEEAQESATSPWGNKVESPICAASDCTVTVGPALIAEGKTMHKTCEEQESQQAKSA